MTNDESIFPQIPLVLDHMKVGQFRVTQQWVSIPENAIGINII